MLQPFMKKNCRRPAKQNSGLIKGLREKAIERLCVKLKGFDYSFNSWINKKVQYNNESMNEFLNQMSILRQEPI